MCQVLRAALVVSVFVYCSLPCLCSAAPVVSTDPEAGEARLSSALEDGALPGMVVAADEDDFSATAEEEQVDANKQEAKDTTKKVVTTAVTGAAIVGYIILVIAIAGTATATAA